MDKLKDSDKIIIVGLGVAIIILAYAVFMFFKTEPEARLCFEDPLTFAEMRYQERYQKEGICSCKSKDFMPSAIPFYQT